MPYEERLKHWGTQFLQHQRKWLSLASCALLKGLIGSSMYQRNWTPCSTALPAFLWPSEELVVTCYEAISSSPLRALCHYKGWLVPPSVGATRRFVAQHCRLSSNHWRSWCHCATRHPVPLNVQAALCAVKSSAPPRGHFFQEVFAVKQCRHLNYFQGGGWLGGLPLGWETPRTASGKETHFSNVCFDQMLFWRISKRTIVHCYFVEHGKEVVHHIYWHYCLS